MEVGSMEFRGTKSGLLLRAHVGSDIRGFIDRLKQRLSKSRGFFSGSSVKAQFEDKEIPVESVRLIVETLRECGLELSSIATSARPRRVSRSGMADEDGLPAVGPDECVSVLVKRTLRSGQRVDFGGSVVVLGDVNPGAEVIAGGDVVVMGSLRGMAHAGAYGDTGAVVVAFRLNPTQLRIANRISRSPDTVRTDPSHPEIARISEDTIVIEAFSVPASGR